MSKKENKTKKKKVVEDFEENQNDKIKLLSGNINALKDNLILTNTYATAYEKSHLDMYLRMLSSYNNIDAYEINDILRKVNYIFTNVGINLSEDNFNYNFHVNNFMRLYLKNKEFKNTELKEIFKNCPNIFKYVSLNYKYLYCQNEGIFNIYYDDLFTVDIAKTYELLCIKKDIVLREDIKSKLSLEDYDKALKIINRFIKKDLNEENLLNIYHFLLEYKYFNSLNFIKEKFQSILKSKNNKYPKIKNKINKKEKVLFKKNEKLNKYIKSNSIEKITKFENSTNKITDTLVILYDIFEIKTIKQKVYNLTNDDTYENIFTLALSNYNFLKYLFEENNLDFDNYYNILFNLVYFPYKKIIKNKWVDDEKLLIDNILTEYNLNENILNNIDESIDNINLIIKNKMKNDD